MPTTTKVEIRNLDISGEGAPALGRVIELFFGQEGYFPFCMTPEGIYIAGRMDAPFAPGQTEPWTHFDKPSLNAYRVATDIFETFQRMPEEEKRRLNTSTPLESFRGRGVLDGWRVIATTVEGEPYLTVIPGWV
jgi:hypothetical protein